MHGLLLNHDGPFPGCIQSTVQILWQMSEAFRSCRSYLGNSTETAATKVYSDLLLAADDGDVTALSLLDLTDAFDTVDHDLMPRLERQFSLRCVVLQWFRSYLTDRTFQIVYAGRKSAVVIIPCSVLQGSVLGLRLFILYMAELADVVSAHDAKHHAYADDMTLSCIFGVTRRKRPQLLTDLQCALQTCNAWMEANRLKLNADKCRV